MHMKTRGIITRLVVVSLLALCLALGATIATAANYESYNESWSFPIQPGDSLLVDMSSVEVKVGTHAQENLSAVFEGRRSPSSGGTMPYIAAEKRGGQISLKVVWPKQSLLGLSGGNLEGTLTVLVPEVLLSSADLATFSGSVSVENISAENISLDSSSGSITAKNLSLPGNLSVNTFSGKQALEAISAKEITLGGSSGNITAADLRAEGALNADTFSGHQSFTDVTAGEILMSGSSGNMTCANMKAAGNITLNTFSGKQDMRGIEAANISATSSSGNVEWKETKAVSLAVETFSARITIAQSTFEEGVTLQTSSSEIAINDLSATALELNTFSGNIKAEGIDVRSFMANTSSGRCSAAFAGNTDVQIETFSGHVDLTFPQNTGIAYEFDTFTGKVTVDAPDAGAQVKDGNDVSGTIGDEASTVTVNTTSGNLNLLVGQ